MPEDALRSVRMPQALLDRLQARADQIDRSVNWLIGQACEAYLEARETTLPPFPSAEMATVGAEFRATLRWHMPFFADDIEKGLLGTETRIRDAMPGLADVLWRYGAAGEIHVTDIDHISAGQLPGNMTFFADGPALVRVHGNEHPEATPRDDITPEDVLAQWRDEKVGDYWSSEEEAKHLTPPFLTAAQQEHMDLVQRAAGGDKEALATLELPRRYVGVFPQNLDFGDVIVLPVPGGGSTLVRITFIQEVKVGVVDAVEPAYRTAGHWFIRYESLDRQTSNSTTLAINQTVDQVLFDEVDWDVAEDPTAFESTVNRYARGDGGPTVAGIETLQ